MDKITITFYDVVGYVIPGFLSLLSIGILISFLTGNPICLTAIYEINVFWQIGIAYIAGHLVQAIVSTVWKNKYDKDLAKTGISQEVFHKFKDKVKKIVQVDSISHYDILIIENNIADDKIVTKVNMFRAFQGLYKGIIGVLILSMAGALCLLIFPAIDQFAIKNTTIHITNVELWILLGSFAAMLIVSIKRHNAFVRSRLRTIVSYYVGRDA